MHTRLVVGDIHTYMLSYLKHTCLEVSDIHTYIHTCSGLQAYIHTLIFDSMHSWLSVSMYVCMSPTTKRVCMLEILNYSPEEWVRLVTESVQYLTFNSIFRDLWGGYFGGLRRQTYIHTRLRVPTYIHTLGLQTYIHTSIHTCIHAWGLQTYIHTTRLRASSIRTYIHTYIHTNFELVALI